MAGPWTWVGGGGNNLFNNPANWNPAEVPNNSSSVSVPGGSSIQLVGSFETTNFTITGTGTVSLSFAVGGPFSILSDGNLNMSASQALDLGGNTFNSSNGLVLTGSGNFQIANGVFHENSASTLSVGQTLTLANATYTTESSVTGGGALVLDGRHRKLQPRRTRREPGLRQRG